MGNLREASAVASVAPKAILFDWDDTICPSSFFDRQQIERMDELPSRVSAPRRNAMKRKNNGPFLSAILVYNF